MNQTIEEEEQGACPYGLRHTIQQAGLCLSRALLVAQLHSTQCSYCTCKQVRLGRAAPCRHITGSYDAYKYYKFDSTAVMR